MIARAWLATKIFLGLVALVALGIWFAEPFGWIWRAGSAILLAAMWCLIFKLCPVSTRFHSVKVDRRVRTGRAARSWFETRDTERVQSNSSVRRPPRSARYTWTLTENGVPVSVEYDKRAVENWMALGADHDSIAHKLN